MKQSPETASIPCAPLSTAAPLAIEAKGLGKRYRIARGEERSGRGNPWGKLGGSVRKEGFWAVRNVDLSVAGGTLLGIVGPNGSGKSTLLKMLAGIVEPTEGTLRAQGRIGALIEVGVGFHPDLTGWENIFLNGSILGMPRSEVRSKLDSIVDFAEVEGKFLDMPVKYYSSGMYARLGFSIAVHSDPNIFLVDEILAVGDEQFRAKSFERIMRMRREGRTVILVTHEAGAAATICDEMIWMVEGRVKAQGDPREIAMAHRREMMFQTIGSVLGAKNGKEPAPGAIAPIAPGAIALIAARAISLDPAARKEIEGVALRTGEPSAVEFELRSNRAFNDLQFVALLTRWDGVVVAEIDSLETGVAHPFRLDGRAALRISFDSLILMAGRYSVSLFFYEGAGRERPIAGLPSALEFHIETDRYQGRGYVVDLPCRWTATRL